MLWKLHMPVIKAAKTITITPRSSAIPRPSQSSHIHTMITLIILPALEFFISGWNQVCTLLVSIIFVIFTHIIVYFIL